MVGGTTKKQDENYIFHTIQPKETLYSLSVRYTVPATAIVKANPGLSTSTFTIGKTIRIPATQVENLPTTEIKTATKEIEYTQSGFVVAVYDEPGRSFCGNTAFHRIL